MVRLWVLLEIILVELTSTGFTVKNGYGNTNAPGETYIYAAFAAGGGEGTVVSTDLAANKMTVDGGNWNAYNQSEVWSNQVSIGFWFGHY